MFCCVIVCADRFANTSPHQKKNYFYNIINRIYYAPVHVKMKALYSNVAIKTLVNHASHLSHILGTR